MFHVKHLLYYIQNYAISIRTQDIMQAIRTGKEKSQATPYPEIVKCVTVVKMLKQNINHLHDIFIKFGNILKYLYLCKKLY